MISFIVCMSKNRVIGKDNKLPWHLPADLKYLKETTMGHTIVMGRKTYDSIGKALPGRKNVIVTRDPDFTAPGCEIVLSLEDIIEREELMFILGGAEIFKQLMPYADKLYITYIDEEFEGDTFFPELDSDWAMVSETKGIRDEKNPYDYYFQVYERKNADA